MKISLILCILLNYTIYFVICGQNEEKDESYQYIEDELRKLPMAGRVLELQPPPKDDTHQVKIQFANRRTSSNIGVFDPEDVVAKTEYDVPMMVLVAGTELFDWIGKTFKLYQQHCMDFSEMIKFLKNGPTLGAKMGPLESKRQRLMRRKDRRNKQKHGKIRIGRQINIEVDFVQRLPKPEEALLLKEGTLLPNDLIAKG